jgi:hypothetical protein
MFYIQLKPPFIFPQRGNVLLTPSPLGEGREGGNSK